MIHSKFIKFIILILLVNFNSCNNQDNISYFELEGLALGTTFHITYGWEQNFILEKQIDSLLHLVNKSMSTYLPNSDISKINNGDAEVIIDDLFHEVFDKSSRIYKETNGFFDPTVGVLVNAWGFGPNGDMGVLDSLQVINLLRFVGFNNVKIHNNRIVKKYMQTYIDFNAIAKGYAVDIIGRYLESNDIDNYLIEIGGEIRARGVNKSEKLWSIAIEKPNFDGTRSFQTVIQLENESIATSGSYRKFKIDSITGEMFAHTIDSKTGYPSKSNLLSVSVVSKLDCSDVDGYATAFMAMGLNRTKKFLLNHQELKVFFIYSDEKGNIKTEATENLIFSEY